MSISADKFKRIFQSQTTTAKKIYDFIPIEEEWTSVQIASEMKRMGKQMTFKIIEGCLNTMKDAGLVHESSDHKFRRIPVTIRDTAPITVPVFLKPETKKEGPMKVEEKKEKSSVGDELVEIHGVVQDMIKTLANVCERIELLELRVRQEQEANEADLKNIAAFKSMIQSFK